MPRKRTSQLKTEPVSSDPQPQPMPMTKSPSESAPPENPMMPMPTAMPGTEVSSSRNPESRSGEAPRVIPMGDYPLGRGGMRMVPMGTSEAVTQSPDISPVRIEGRPPATKMPSA